MLILNIIKVFCCGLAIDLGYTLWMSSVSKGNKLLAGLFSVAIYLPGLFGLFAILENHYMSVFYGGGLFSGTILGMYLTEFIEKQKKIIPDKDN